MEEADGRENHSFKCPVFELPRVEVPQLHGIQRLVCQSIFGNGF
jgi:hypothetical protein